MFEGFGLEMEGYEGECLYFKGGSAVIGTGDTSTVYDTFAYGYCIECNGNAGCSSTQTCDDFATGLPQNENIYTMSMGEDAHASNNYQSTDPDQSKL